MLATSFFVSTPVFPYEMLGMIDQSFLLSFRPVSVWGVADQGEAGAEDGPQVIRKAGLVEELKAHGLSVADYGDIKIESDHTGQPGLSISACNLPRPLCSKAPE